MEILSNGFYYVVVPIVFLSILIFVHELGHYLVARWAGVRVEVFSIGFGPEARGWTDSLGTRWKLSTIPLGGYVKMFGESGDTIADDDGNERPMTERERAESFHHKPLGSRAAVVAAGPLANFLFTIVVLAVMFVVVGQPRTLPVIGDVVEDSAAAQAGLLIGDRVTAINGVAVEEFQDLHQIVLDSPGKTLLLDVVRDGAPLQLTAVPQPREKGGGGILGVRPHPEFVDTVRYGPIGAIWAATVKTGVMIVQILDYVADIFTGDRSAEELGGPVMIFKLAGDMAQISLSQWIYFMAVLSVNLGLINLFPIPMLDGGHLVFYGIEALRGKPLGEKAQEYGFRVGLILVLALMVFATWNDVVRMIQDTL